MQSVFDQAWELVNARYFDPQFRGVDERLTLTDGARTLARIQDQDVKDRLLANTESSVARGSFGAPTCFVGSEMFFGQDRLDFVREALCR